MVAAVNTGVPFPGGVVNAPGQEQQSPNTFFNTLSTSNLSHIFSVDESPYYLKAFELDEGATIQVWMVTKGANNSDITQPMFLGGVEIKLTPENNCLVIDIPGRYQLNFTGSFGAMVCVGGLTALSYWSWGLKAYVETAAASA